MNTFVNLTPHAVTVIAENDTVVACVPPSGTIARLAEQVTSDGTIDGVDTVIVDLGHVDGLPDPAADTTYVVSMPLLMGMTAAGIDRLDVVYPFGQVRDGGGRIIGCRQFARIARPAV